jgi:hypothetical protein
MYFVVYLYDDEEQSQVQFVGFVGEHSRYDLMHVQTDRHSIYPSSSISSVPIIPNLFVCIFSTSVLP